MNKVQMFFNVLTAALGAVFGFLFGEVTGLFWALLAFMALDYLTGVIIAIVNKRLSSEVGFKGLSKKLFILVFVAVGHIMDTLVLDDTGIVMSAVMLFYIANEGISLIENAALLGLPVPQKIKDILEQIKNKADKEDKQ